MSIISAPNTHKQHWSVQVELQINPVLISCIRMSWDVQVPFLSENVIRCVSLLGLPTSGLFPLGRFFYSPLSWGSIFGGLFKACFVEKGCKDPRTRGFKKRLNIAGDVVQGRNIKQAAKSRLKSTG
jgi:hypothetical protein